MPPNQSAGRASARRTTLHSQPFVTARGVEPMSKMSNAIFERMATDELVSLAAAMAEAPPLELTHEDRRFRAEVAAEIQRRLSIN